MNDGGWDEYAAVLAGLTYLSGGIFWTFLCVFARIFAAISVSSFFPSTDLPKLFRASLAFILTIVITPALFKQYPSENSAFTNFAWIFANYIYGFILGYLLSFPVWIIEACGNIIDMQRGEQMGSILNPLTGSQSSSIGRLLTRAFLTYFIIHNGLLYFINTLYTSFQVIQFNSISFLLSRQNVENCISMFTKYIYLSVDLVLPIIVALLLVDLILSLVSSFIQQLNVTVLSMPIKSTIALLILCICVGDLFHNVFTKFISQTKVVLF